MSTFHLLPMSNNVVSTGHAGSIGADERSVITGSFVMGSLPVMDGASLRGETADTSLGRGLFLLILRRDAGGFARTFPRQSRHNLQRVWK